jgi:hypothetical protein
MPFSFGMTRSSFALMRSAKDILRQRHQAFFGVLFWSPPAWVRLFRYDQRRSGTAHDTITNLPRSVPSSYGSEFAPFGPPPFALAIQLQAHHRFE